MDTALIIASAIVGFVLVLTIVVFIHEFGHFFVARWCGVAVKTFSIGFGPEIVGFNDRHGTRWKLSWIPLGGYVQFVDDENATSARHRPLDELTPEERKGSFQNKPLSSRAAVVAAGPVANFILAVIAFTAMLALFGERVVPPKVDVVASGSAAERAGFKPGDVVISIDGRSIDNFAEMQEIVSTSPGIALRFEVEREGTRIELTATPELKEIDTGFGKVPAGLLGLQRTDKSDVTVKDYRLVPAFLAAVERTYAIVVRTFTFPFNVARGRESADQIGGPILIAQMSGKVFSQLFGDVQTSGSLALFWIALISASIGAINLFPIPMLDGGHLLYYLIEAIKGRPLSEGAQEIGLRIGFGLILLLMIFAFRNDLIRVFWL